MLRRGRLAFYDAHRPVGIRHAHGVHEADFIAPLVAVFMLAARGADAAQMSRWSKRNVFPSKLALGLVFALLGVLVLCAVHR